MYVPAIALVKEGVLDTSGEVAPCTRITYTYYVTNQSTAGERFEFVTLDDPTIFGMGGQSLDGNSGDVNGNNFLEVGEVWTFTADYDITLSDRIAGQVTASQARVEGSAEFGLGIFDDDSDDNSPFEDDFTVVDISTCQPRVSLTKTGLLDPVGFPPCTTIEYSFTVTNESVRDNLQVTTLNDPILNNGPITGPLGDTGGDGVMDVGEVWGYRATYTFTQDDLNFGYVDNQASVTAAIVGGLPGDSVSDLSHESDPLLDGYTRVTDIINCQNPVVLMLLTVNSFPDADNDGCPDAVAYTYTVQNNGNVDLNITSLTDDLGNSITLPNPNPNDLDSDGILDIGEEWVYTSQFDIDQDDIDNSPLENQATLLTTIAGSGTPVPAELSHPTDFTDEGVTSTSLSGTCPEPASIGLIKELDTLIDMDADGCPDAIQYTLRVLNKGNINMTDVVVNDPNQLGPNVPGPFSEDITVDGILEVGEEWVYIGTYDIDQADVIAGSVTGQAEVFADPIPGVTISDLSHPNDFDDDAFTSINVMGTCHDTVAVGVTKSFVQTLDNDMNGCDDQIRYSIVVENLGGMDLLVTDLDDQQLGNIIAGPFVESSNPDGVLEVNETWAYTGIYNITVPDATLGSVSGQATVTAQPVGTTVDITDNDFLLVNIPGACADGPAIAVVRSATLDDMDGDNCNEVIHFVIEVTNVGGLDLTNVTLDDSQLLDLTGQHTGDDDNDGELDQIETWIYNGTYNITQTDIDFGSVVGSATAEANPVGNNAVLVSDDSHPFDPGDNLDNSIDVSGACDDTVAISITRQAILQDNFGDGCDDTILFTITIENQGNADLENVMVNDTQLGGNLSPTLDGDGDALLESMEIWTYSGQYDIDQDEIDNSPLFGQAEVFAQHVGSTFQVTDNASNNIDVSNACDTFSAGITLLQVASISDLNDGNCPDTISYSYTVHNPAGNVDLDSVVLMDNFFGLISGPDSGDVNNNGRLEAGETWVYSSPTHNITQNDIDNSPFDNFSTVSAEPVGTNTVITDMSHPSNPAEDGPTSSDIDQACAIPLSPSIGLIKQAAPSLIDFDNDGCDDTIVYTYFLQNLGNEDIINIVFDDPMLENTNPVVESGDIGTDNILGVGETWIFESFNYAITPTDSNAEEVITQATVTGLSSDSNTEVSDLSDDNEYLENDPTRTSVIGTCPNDTAEIGLIKTASLFDSNGDNCDDSILYFFTVENLGNVPLQDVLLEDNDLNASLNQPSSRSLNDDEILDVGEQWSYNLIHPISQADIDRTFMENQAMVTAFRTDLPDTMVSDLSHENHYSADGPTITSTVGACVNNMSGIGLIKTGRLTDGNNDSCPESIQYTLIVANLGNLSLTGITLRDDLLVSPIEGPISGDDNGNAILDPGEEWEYTALYGITQEDLSTEQVENQATVTASIVGEPTSLVNDLSDGDGYAEDTPTTVSVSDACEDEENIQDSDFRIFNGISPNGDGINDFFHIRGIEEYPDNSLQIFNRWGVLVYNANQYGTGNTLFGGISYGRATVAEERELPSGTYFYILSFPTENPGKESYTGYLYINRD